jgi:hypothetical protein
MPRLRAILVVLVLGIYPYPGIVGVMAASWRVPLDSAPLMMLAVSGICLPPCLSVASLVRLLGIAPLSRGASVLICGIDHGYLIT